ncbi:MAG: hypothetical protein RLZZ387_2531 [Chloroflexota bacterium]|jgi:Flp pilus assembly protein TadG
MEHYMFARSFAPHHTPGQSIVEFALVLPIFLMLVLGFTCVMQIMLVQDTVAQATRAAAHQAALIGGSNGENGSLETVGGDVADAARAVLDGSIAARSEGATITVSCADQSAAETGAQCRRYDPITVTISYADVPWVPIPPLFTEVQAEVSATRISENDQQ